MSAHGGLISTVSTGVEGSRREGGREGGREGKRREGRR